MLTSPSSTATTQWRQASPSQGRSCYRGCFLRAAQTYANVLVVKEGRENDPAIQALYAALTSDKVKDYINSTYDGAVVPIF